MSKNKNSISNLSNNLTPFDFIYLLKNDPDMNEEFCYLNKVSGSYNFKVVDFEDKNNDEYMTISSRVFFILPGNHALLSRGLGFSYDWIMGERI